MDSNLNLNLTQSLRPQPLNDLHFEAKSSADPFDGRSSSVDHGCSLSVMSYITFAAITVSTVININNVSSFSIYRLNCSVIKAMLKHLALLCTTLLCS